MGDDDLGPGLRLLPPHAAGEHRLRVEVSEGVSECMSECVSVSEGVSAMYTISSDVVTVFACTRLLINVCVRVRACVCVCVCVCV